jgi:lipopolysaccharide exporter
MLPLTIIAIYSPFRLAPGDMNLSPAPYQPKSNGSASVAFALADQEQMNAKETEQTETLSRRVAKGGLVLVVLRLSIRLIGLISTMILFRILAPDDFGLVALATVVLGLAEVLAEFGFEQTLLRNNKATRNDYDVVWTLTFLRGILCSLFLLAISLPSSIYLNEPRLLEIILWLALVPMLDGLGNIGVVDFSKELNFGKEYQLKVSQKVISFCLTIFFAFWLRNYWALVIGILSGKVVGLGLSYWLHPYRPRFSLKGARAVFEFSIWIFFNHLILYCGNQTDKVIIQKNYDAHMVGIFRVAEEICSIVMELVWPVEKALYAGYAKLAADFSALRQAVLSSSGFVAMLGVPMSIGIFLVAEPLVAILLGDKGLPAVPFVQILVLHGAIRSCIAGAGAAFMVLGKPQINAQTTLISVFVRLTVLFAAFPTLGVMSAPWSLVAGSCVSFLIVWIQIKRNLKLRWRDFPAALWRTWAATGLMVLAVYGLAQSSMSSFFLGYHWAELIVKSGVGAVVYLLSIALLWRISGLPEGPESKVLQLIKAEIYRRASRVP